MTSARDKLRAKNAENSKNRGNTSTKETVFGDFINRPEENKNSENEIKKNEEAAKEVKENEEIAKKNTIKESEVNNSTISDNLKEAEPAKEEHNNENKPSKPGIMYNEYDNKYFAPAVIERYVANFPMSEEAYLYLCYKPLLENTTCKDLMTKLILKAKDEEPDKILASQYRGTLHYTKRKSITFNKEVNSLIQEIAKKYLMRKFAFLAYILHKAYNEDKEFQEEMKKLT